MRCSLLTLVSAALAGGVPLAADAGGVVGSGTPESCTKQAFVAALVGGGLVTFDCGEEQHSIVVDTTLIENGTTTTVDGGGRIVLNGESLRQHFFVLGGGNLTLRDLALTDGNTGAGGSIHNIGATRIESVQFAFNEGVGLGGGAIYNTGTLEIFDSHFFANSATAKGGAILVGGGEVNIERCLFELNEAEDGGAIFMNASFVDVRNSTLVENVATDGGGIAIDAGVVELVNSTLDQNQADHGGAVFRFAGGGSTRNTVFSRSLNRAGDSEALECDSAGGGTLLSFGGNLVSDGSCQLASPDDRNATDPMLGSRADNGGPTLTIAPLPGSPLIDGGIADGCPDLDQRGFARPADGDDPDAVAECDIGAVEIDAPEPAAPGLVALVGLALAALGRRAASKREERIR